MSKKTFIDLNASDTFNSWLWLSNWGMPRRELEWPQWLTCPVHYQQYGIDWGKDVSFSYVKGTAPFDKNEPLPSLPSRSGFIDGIAAPDVYELSVREVNNLVRFLYTNGWISRTAHPEVHTLLDDLIPWLEARGIKVDMDMGRIE